jgi:hypothetical protein
MKRQKRENGALSWRSVRTQHRFIDTRSRKPKQDGRHGFQETSKVTFFNYTRKRRRAMDNVASIRSWKWAGVIVFMLQSKVRKKVDKQKDWRERTLGEGCLGWCQIKKDVKKSRDNFRKLYSCS